MFTPCLYANVVFDDRNENILVEHLEELLKNEGWKYTRSLDFDIPDIPQNDPLSTLELCKRYNEGIQALSNKMHRLTGLS